MRNNKQKRLSAIAHNKRLAEIKNAHPRKEVKPSSELMSIITMATVMNTGRRLDE